MLEFVVSEDLPPCCLQGGKHAHIQGLQLMCGVEGRTTKTISRCPKAPLVPASLQVEDL
jgi:hypothetical protein